MESVCNEFRELYENIKGTTPYCVKTVAVLNCWGQQRAWGCHMVHHALYQKQNYSYAGVIEALSGAPFDVKFISFDDIKADPKVLDGLTSLSTWATATPPTPAARSGRTRRFPPRSGALSIGGGLIGVGEPGGHRIRAAILQLAACWAWRRKRLHPKLRQVQLGRAPATTLFWPTAPTMTWTLARARRTSMPGGHRNSHSAGQGSADGCA